MSKGKRVAILAIAILFLVTSVAFSVAVFLEVGKTDDVTSELTSQNQDTANEQQQEENMLQGTKLDNFEPVTAVNELQKVDLQEGSGEVVTKGATITAHYTGAFASTGEIFESSLDRGAPFTAQLVTPEESADGNGLIKGWVEGIDGMKVGGKRRLIIPGELAYGKAPEGYVPDPTQQPLGPLVFDIEVISVESSN